MSIPSTGPISSGPPAELSQKWLLRAAQYGDVRLLTQLLAAGIDPNYCDLQENETPLFGAAIRCHFGAMEVLLQQGANPNFMYGRCESLRKTALHWLARDITCEGHLQAAQLLLAKGADPNARLSEYDATPLQEAVSLVLLSGRPPRARFQLSVQLAALLLERGAELNIKRRKLGTAGTALDMAAHAHNPLAVDFLLSRGAVSGVESHLQELSPLQEIVSYHYPPEEIGDALQAIQALLAKERDIPILYWAVMTGANLEVVQLLLQEATHFPLTTRLGETPLYAVRLWVVTIQDEREKAEQCAIVRLLLERGISVHARDRFFDQTPLHSVLRGKTRSRDRRVCEREWEKETLYGISLLSLFLDKGADLNARDEMGNTPLHLADPRLPPELFRFLLRQGADGALINRAGKTPLDSLLLASSSPATQEKIREVFLDVAKEREQKIAEAFRLPSVLTTLVSGYCDPISSMRKEALRS